MSTIDVIVAHCHPSRGIVSGFVITPKSVHHIGHHPGEGWFCLSCSRSKSCRHIDDLKDVLPVRAIEAATEGLNRAPVIRVGDRVRLPSGRTGVIVGARKRHGIEGADVQIDGSSNRPEWLIARLLEVVTVDG